MIKKGEWLLILFNLAYIIPFTIYYISIRNFEFMGYIIIVLALFTLISLTLRKTKFSHKTLWGLSLWGLLHMIGGGIIINGGVAYAWEVIPIWVTDNFFILKYDQIVHAYLYFVMVFVIWDLVKNQVSPKASNWILYPAVALISIGIGGLNEIAEFIAVLSLPETGVGGYYNTAWDIVFNTLGAILGTILLHFRRKISKK